MSYVDQKPTKTNEDQEARMGGVDSRITTSLAVHKMANVKYGARCAVCLLEYRLKNSLGQIGMAKNDCHVLCVPDPSSPLHTSIKQQADTYNG